MQASWLTRGTLAVVACLGATAMGCGGATASIGDGGDHDAGSPDGASARDGSGGDAGALDGGGVDATPPLSADCPATIPTSGSSCTREQLECEYGSAWWSVACDPVVRCDGGQWTPVQVSYEPCSAAPGPNPASCPPDIGSLQPGSACSTDGVSCLYPQGQCECEVPLEGPVEIDGGTGYWQCIPEEPDCPFPRPPLGSACNGSQSDCTYEVCSYAQSCQDGTWHGNQEACAEPGLAPSP